MNLMSFQKEVNKPSFRIIITTTSIIGQFTEAETELAITKYNAIATEETALAGQKT
jgi:hypothetical protein